MYMDLRVQVPHVLGELTTQGSKIEMPKRRAIVVTGKGRERWNSLKTSGWRAILISWVATYPNFEHNVLNPGALEVA